MASPVTLFIVEGEKRDVRFLNDLADEITAGTRTVETLVLPASQNIYMIYDQLEEDDFETDIIEVLRESSPKAASLLADLQRDDVDEVYLFFDFDPQHFKRKGMDSVKGGSSNILAKMLEIFDNETDLGKLYISYPMIEAAYDYKRGESLCAAYSSCFIPFASLNKYKSLAGKDNPIASEHKFQWKELLNVFIQRAICLFDREGIGFLEYRQYVTPTLIYREQEKLLNVNNVVFCLSALPEFLLDYYGEEYWHDNIDGEVINRRECDKRGLS